MKLLVDERDMKFVLYEQLRMQELCKAPIYADFSQETFDMILEEAAKLAERAFYPSNKKGDVQGCRFENGKVKVPDSFHEPYRLYREGGWLAMSDSPEVGGQGLPVVLSHACIEMLGAANWSLLMYAGLTHGAAYLLQKFGTPELQGLYHVPYGIRRRERYWKPQDQGRTAAGRNFQNQWPEDIHILRYARSHRKYHSYGARPDRWSTQRHQGDFHFPRAQAALERE